MRSRPCPHPAAQVRLRLNPSPAGFNSTLATNDTASYYLNL